jgi:hypothetical protein
MPIDFCSFSFDELAVSVLPKHFNALQASLANPFDAEILKGCKSATRDALKRLDLKSDFPGCYVFIDSGTAVYVGISRTVVKRLIQHLNHDSHYSASLAYRIAFNEFPHEMKRDQAMKDEKFRAYFLKAQNRLRNMKFGFVKIENDLELYLLEVYAAMHLNTDKWNTFRTH